MKILKDNKIFVQKNDMAYLNSSGLDIPASIFIKVFGHGVTIIDNHNRYEFIEFVEPSEVEFFQNIDWIVDYNAIKNMSEEEIISIAKSVATERKEKTDKFNAMCASKRKRKYEEVSRELDLLDYKMYSLRDIILLKRRELDYPFPDGIEHPRELISAEPKAEITEGASKKEVMVKTKTNDKKGIKSIFKKLNQ